MKFIDEATIEVKAGHGGRGAKSFRREKYVPYGGPDGGNGGAGGSVILRADRNLQTLLDFKFRPIWEAQSGEGGSGSLSEGKSGDDLHVRVPIGTQVFRAGTTELVADLDTDGMEFVLAKGGRGGKGNAFFKSATNQAPEHFQPGEEGEAGSYTLSLKLVADVGLLGFPNAGKSTLISRISAARPKIADYPFTTLVPNLGVVQLGSRSFVVADIPGLIPGAAEGKGLGIRFLKHVERTKLLAHLIDCAGIDEQGEPLDPLLAFQQINDELAKFSPELAARPQVVVLTKTDIVPDRSNIATTEQRIRELGYPVIAISSATGEHIPELIKLLGQKVLQEQSPPASPA